MDGGKSEKELKKQQEKERKQAEVEQQTNSDFEKKK